MSKRLYVGNLPYSMDQQRLAQVFEENGHKPASSIVVTDRDTQQSKGFGFVEFLTEKEAHEAMAVMNGMQADGRSLKVDLANERPARSGGGGGGGGGGGWGGGGGGGGGGRGRRD